MSASSYNPSKQNSKKPKDIRGGEQKVMKKSLSTILSLAMAFSMFSSVALAAEADATKTSADFTDLKDLDAATKLKFDALISAGVFDGVKEGTFGLKDEMNRAQFAKVAALIFGLKVDTTLKTSTFTDVKSDDPANGYALPYIEAVKAAGITDGYAPGEYNPAGKVTKEQLAAFLLRGLGKDAAAKATPGVTDTTVSDWAKGYVALALQLKLLSNGTDGKFAGTSNATRDLLVLSASEAKAQYKPIFNGKYSIASFKATDADKLTLQLNGALTDEAAKALKIEIKKDGNVATNYTTKWSDDKTTATLTFDTKFQNNVYGVTISGPSNLDTTAVTSSVTTTIERIAKIEFLTAAESLPRTTNKLRINFKATNQYGAKSSLSYNNFTINAGSNISVTGVSGEQSFYIQQPQKSGITNPTSNDSALERNDRISVTIIHEDSGATANKVFAVGDSPNVSKVEIGDLLNSANTKIETIEANKDTYLGLKAYDQYGIPVEDSETLNRGITFYSTEGNVVRVAKDKNSNDAWFTQTSEIGDDAADLKFKYNKIESKENITLTVIANGSGQTATKTVKVNAPKTPASVEIGAYNYTLAEGDVKTGDSALDQKFYVPLVVKDAKGDLLTPSEIADNAYKFSIYGTGSVNPDTTSKVYNSDTKSETTTAIVQTGEHKGQIAIASVGYKGSAGITIMLLDTPNVKASWSTNVAEKRRADKIVFSATPKKYMVNNTDNEFKVKVYDQNGGELKYNLDNTRVRFALQAANETSVNAGTNPSNLTLKSNEVAAAGINPVTKALQSTVDPIVDNSVANNTRKFILNPTVVGTVYTNQYDYSANNGSYVGNTDYTFPLSEVFDKSYKFFTPANAKLGTNFTFNAYLETYDNSTGKWNSISNVNTNLEVLDTTKSTNKLTIEAFADKALNNTLLAARDYLGESAIAANGTTSVQEATYVYNTNKKLAKEIKLLAKTSSGDLVAVPNGNIKTITSSNPKVAEVVSGQRFIVGLEAGTAKITVTYVDGKGDYNTSAFDVTTKNEGPSVTSITTEKSSNTISGAEAQLKKDRGMLYVWDTNMAKKVTIKDQFGGEYVSDRTPLTNIGGVWYGTLKDDNSKQVLTLADSSTDQFIQKHANILNMTFYATDVKSTSGTGKVEIDNTGKITTLSADVTSFTINIFSPSGKSATTSVTVN
ncbi:S-layer homology domain-containing protein [Paenibacillus periandrae]|uniref:S-layer homology domain-containing protein n=1 Tax=Paenibacillus periandrae TaxID=1761741 RepID=UPI001F0893D9|nr:S-layer homology domain-containing protein [Paenibacillus periandrae]